MRLSLYVYCLIVTIFVTIPTIVSRLADRNSIAKCKEMR